MSSRSDPRTKLLSTVPIVLNLQKFIPLLLDIQALKAMVAWPKFSATAYTIVSDLCKQSIRPKTLIDVGSNVGQFTIAAIQLFKNISVHAFEPVDSCVRRLRRNTDAYRDIHIYPVALGAKREKVAFHIDHYSQASSIFNPSRKHRLEFSKLAKKKDDTHRSNNPRSPFFRRGIRGTGVVKNRRSRR
jgi:FkbM family methyltransferase